MKVYGIPNCDSVKKTKDWLTKHRIPFEFHDYKKEGISLSRLENWSRQVGWEILLNKKGTTWKKLPEEEQKKIAGEKAALMLMVTHTSLIKRPVIEYKNGIVVGFDEAQFIKQLK